MRTEERRRWLLALLRAADGAVTGSALAERFGVSRQIIVGDISILRAEGAEVLATPRGYLVLRQRRKRVMATLSCCHRAEEMQDELNIMVDGGARVRDVIVAHPVYGELRADLMLESRRDVAAFVRKMRETAAPPLSYLTDGVHVHTIEAEEASAIEEIRAALERAGFLVPDAAPSAPQ